MIVFLVMGKRLLWICSLYLSTQRDYCQKLIQTLKLSCLCTVGCGGCNLNWLQKSVERLWCHCFKLKHSVGLSSMFLSRRSHHSWPKDQKILTLLNTTFFFIISTSPIWRLFVALIVGSIPTSNKDTHPLTHLCAEPPNTSSLSIFTHMHTHA